MHPTPMLADVLDAAQTLSVEDKEVLIDLLSHRTAEERGKE